MPVAAAPTKRVKKGDAPPLPLEGQPTERLVSLDAYRGLAMLLMASEIMGLHHALTTNYPKDETWQAVAHQLDHVEWAGGVLWDMIQPSFMFMVGVALPFSIASRKAKGQGFKRMLGHALWRSLVLVLLGIFLRSIPPAHPAKDAPPPHTNWMFTDVLGQIGLGYTFLFLFAWLEVRWQVVAAAALLVGDWLLFATYPTPKQGFAWAAVGVPANWPYHLNGFAVHWDKNSNVAAAFDKWFLNLFPRAVGKDGKPQAFVYEPGGYETLNFIPSLATMTFGLLAGELLRSERSKGQKVGYLMAGAVAVGALGTAADYFGLCPIVKRIWTPAWALYAAGWTGVTLALFYLVIDVAKLRKWALPLVVVGMNSIAMYVMAHVTKPFVFESLRTHFGRFFEDKDPWVNVKLGGVTLGILWLVCLWMYRKKVFVKV